MQHPEDLASLVLEHRLLYHNDPFLPIPPLPGYNDAVADYYPVFLDLRGKRCLVVGGGSVAERKVRGLLPSTVGVVVVSPSISPALRQLADEGAIEVIERAYKPDDVEGFFMIIAATDDREVNRQVFDDAEVRDRLINTVDDPEHCRFILPSVVKRGSLTLAISTSGKSPALAKKMREELENIFPEEYGDYLEQVTEVRSRLKERVGDPAAREKVWRTLMDSGLLELLKQGSMARVEMLLDEIMEGRL